jgi:tetratricopeptide (TPR) repeat protein
MQGFLHRSVGLQVARKNSLTMTRIVLALVISMATVCQTFACLNGASVVLKNGTFLYEDEEGHIPYGHLFNSEEGFRDGILELDSLYKATKDLDYLSDKGLLLILLKQYNDAIALYLKIEELEPNRYSTASNIGTAYELIGQNEHALHWIKKAIDIDPSSHYNSEWIHVKILEAKIKGEKFINSAFLLNTDFGNDSIPVSSLARADLSDLSEALYFQLNERVSFVKPTDKIAAQLLFDLGNIAFLLGDFYDASADYEQAKEYGFTEKLIDKRIALSEASLKQQLKSSTLKNKFQQNQYSLYVGSAALLIFITVMLYKRRKKDRS